MKVFYAEDDVDFQDWVGLKLKQAGHQVTPHDDAEDLLVSLVAQTTACDAVVTDNTMLGISGLELLRLLKADGRFAHLPVIVFSADDDIRAEVDGLGGIFLHKDRDGIDGVLKALGTL